MCFLLKICVKGVCVSTRHFGKTLPQQKCGEVNHFWTWILWCRVIRKDNELHGHNQIFPYYIAIGWQALPWKHKCPGEKKMIITSLSTFPFFLEHPTRCPIVVFFMFPSQQTSNPETKSWTDPTELFWLWTKLGSCCALSKSFCAWLLEKSRKRMSGDVYHNNMFHSLAILLPIVTCHSANIVPIKGKLESQTKISMYALFGWWEGWLKLFWNPANTDLVWHTVWRFFLPKASRCLSSNRSLSMSSTDRKKNNRINT